MPERGSVRRIAPWLGAALAIAIADQLSKLAVLAAFAPGESRAVTGFFNLVLVFNKGAAFSFLAGASGWQTPVLTGISLAAVGIVTWMLYRNPGRRLLCSALALVLGGALGNLIDRFAYGQVVDFLDVYAFGWHWPAFNLADAAITAGAALLILEGFVHRNADAKL